MSSYTGSCHCSTVKYAFTISPPIDEQNVASCDCSYCTVSGRLLVHPLKTDFDLVAGADNISEYRFGSKSLTASFCKTCGANLFVVSKVEGFFFGKIGVNVRTVQGVDIANLKLKKFNGREFNFPPYIEKE